METRPKRFSESQQVIEWLVAGKTHNHCDLGVLDYPTLEVWAAGDEEVDCYLPMHGGLILESVAFRPEADAKRKYVAVLAALSKGIERAQASGIREVFFMSSDARTDESAKKLGFEEVKMLRKKL